jgi:hypothetical protein
MFVPVQSIFKGWAQSDAQACAHALWSVDARGKDNAVLAYLSGRVQVDPEGSLKEAQEGVAGVSPKICVSRILLDWLHENRDAAAKAIQSGQYAVEPEVWSALYHQQGASPEQLKRLLQQIKDGPSAEKWSGFVNFIASQASLPADITAALTTVDNDLPTHLRDQAKAKLADHLSYSNPEALPQVFASLTPSSASDAQITSGIRAMGQACPDVALDWLASPEAGPASSVKEGLYRSLFDGWMSKDPTQAMQSVLTMKNPDAVKSFMNLFSQNILGESAIAAACNLMPPAKKTQFIQLSRDYGANIYEWMSPRK